MYTSEKMFDAAQSRYENMLPKEKPRMFVGYFTDELTDKEIDTIVQGEERWT